MNRADRRFRRQRKLARAAKMLAQWGLPRTFAAYWADNMAKCSCDMCTAPHRKEHHMTDAEMYAAAREWE